MLLLSGQKSPTHDANRRFNRSTICWHETVGKIPKVTDHLPTITQQLPIPSLDEMFDAQESFHFTHSLDELVSMLLILIPTERIFLAKSTASPAAAASLSSAPRTRRPPKKWQADVRHCCPGFDGKTWTADHEPDHASSLPSSI
jgi:hypothetical protein